MSKMVPACGPSTCLRPPITMKGLERHYPYPSVSPAPPSKRTRLNSIQAVVQGFIRGCDICDKELYDLSHLGQSGGQMVCRQCREGIIEILRSRKRKLPANKSEAAGRDDPLEGGSRMGLSDLKKSRPMTETSKTKETHDEGAAQDQNQTDSSEGGSPCRQMITMRNARLCSNSTVLKNIKNTQGGPVATIPMEILPVENNQVIFKWNIKEFARKMRESGGSTSSAGVHDSPVFRTGQSGYEMCARVYLNGDGPGKGSHVSFYIALHKGSCDDLLRWPFRQKVILTLEDQEKGTAHLVEPLSIDPGSVSFQRPQAKGQVNRAYGCQRFVASARLRDDSCFVVEDTAVFKVVVIMDE